MIEAARLRVKAAKFHVMNILRLRFDDSTFDGVVCKATLIHIRKSQVHKALNEINRVLKDSGILFLYVKKGKGEGFEKDERYNREERFYSYFTEEGLRKLMEESGFEILLLEHITWKDSYRKGKRIALIAKKST